jgi:DNA-binding GntR family transcriptional regulator
MKPKVDKRRKYLQIRDYFKKRIQTGKYPVDAYLPSENEICVQFGTTRTTVRKALDELLKEGFIEKEHGKGSRVLERRKSLGLLTVKGFSEVTDYQVKTVVLQEPKIGEWDDLIAFPLTAAERNAPCVYFQRVRYLEERPIVLEHNWYSQNALEPLRSDDFIDGSFFKTLSQEYLIEIMGSEQELRAETANQEVARNLDMEQGDPVLHISVRFKTSRPELNLYSEIYCKTTTVPVRNSYFL